MTIKIDMDELARLYKEGKTITEIARKFEVSHNTIKSRIKELGIYEGNNRTTYRKNVDNEKLIEMYKEGYSLEDIAKTVGMSSWGVRDRLKMLGEYYVRDNVKRKRKVSDKDIIELYNKGTSISEIANKHNVTYCNVLQRVKELGIYKRRGDRPDIKGEKNPLYRDDVDNKKLIDMYNEGYSIAYLAKEFNMSKGGILNRVKALGVYRKRGSKYGMPVINGKNKNDDEMIDLYKSGVRISELAKKYNMTYKGIQYRLKVLGAYEKKGIEGENNPAYRNDVDNDKIINMYKNGISVAKIADTVGMSKSGIVKRLKRLGVYQGR